MGLEQDLADLEEILQSTKIIPFPGHRRTGRYGRAALSRFTSLIYLFPDASQPNLREPVQIFQNGLGPLVINDEVNFVPVGPRRTLVVIFTNPVRVGDVIQATYLVARE